LRDIAFSSKNLSISRGTTVTFSWRDENTSHNLASTGAKRFTAIPDRQTGSRSRRFTNSSARAGCGETGPCGPPSSFHGATARGRAETGR